jgi:hypothetical protein
VPAGVGDVVVELVVGIPAEDDVAEAEAVVEGREELVPRHVLAAQDAVEVEDADLDVVEVSFLDDAPRLGGGLDGPRSHVASCGTSARYSPS